MHEALKGLANGLYCGALLTWMIAAVLFVVQSEYAIIPLKVGLAEMLISMATAMIAIINKK